MNGNIIKSIIFAAVALAAGISPERSGHCEAMSLEGCAWAATETVGGYTWAYINGDTVEIDRCIHSVAGGNTIEWFVATNFYNLKKSL